MSDREEPRRAAAICENCETAHSVRVGPEGEIRPIGTGHGPECTCGDSDFRLLSADTDLAAEVESKTQPSTE